MIGEYEFMPKGVYIHKHKVKYWKGKRHSDETRRKMSIAHLGKIHEYCQGDKHWKWKGDEVGYNALHMWKTKQDGKPFSCKHCGEKGRYNFYIKQNILCKMWSIHWANKSGKYLRDLTDWISLCSSCHKKYDLNRIK